MICVRNVLFDISFSHKYKYNAYGFSVKLAVKIRTGQFKSRILLVHAKIVEYGDRQRLATVDKTKQDKRPFSFGNFTIFIA